MSAPISVLAGFDWAAVYEGLPNGFGAPRGERQSIEAVCGRGSAAYGEIEPEAASTLLGWLQPTPRDVLFDLGSGAGRLLVQAVFTTPVGRAIGIELCPHRHGIASRARQRLLASLPPEAADAVASRLDFRLGDARAADVACATLVYLGATCFPDALMRELTRHLVTTAPAIRAIASARPLPAGSPRALVEVGRMDLAMTWSKRVGVHVYAVRGRCNGATPRLQNLA